MTENHAQPRRELPAWVFLLIILLCLGGGIAFVVWYFRTPNPISEQVVFKSPEQIAAERAERRRNAQARAGGQGGWNLREVSREGEIRTYQVSGNNITMHVRDNPNGEKEFTFRHPRGLNLLPFEMRNLARMRWRILGDDNVADYLRVTVEQRRRLREMELSNDLVVSPEQVERMRKLWDQANVRSGRTPPDIRRQIVELLNTIATESESPTRALWTSQLQSIQSILTPEQIAAYAQMGRSGAQRPPPPATQPSQ